MVNLNWNSDNESQQDWVFLHFDSHPCNDQSMKYGLEFGRHMLGLGDIQVRSFEIPVVSQPAGSNDCGFYPAYFLEIILQDVDFFIQKCIEVFLYSDLTLSLIFLI